MSDTGHWDDRYRTVGATEVSWYEPEPTVSLELLDALAIGPDRSLLDVGGGASTLVDHLLARGHQDLTILDLSTVALDEARRRLEDPAGVAWIHHDLLTWEPPRTWQVWHDRAVLHFLTSDDERRAYARTLTAALAPGGAFVLGAFAPDGPTHCSGLEVRRQGFDDLAELVGREAHVVERRHHLHRTPSGAGQSFNWIAGHLAPPA